MIDASNTLDRILMECIQEIEEHGWTVEDCLRRYPHLRQDLEPMLEAAIHIKNVRSVQPSSRFRRETLSRMQLRLQASRRPPKSIQIKGSVPAEGVLPKARIQPGRRSSPQWVWSILVGTFAFIVMVGGFTYAANAANPGDVLYQVDQAIERAQIRLTSSAVGQVKLYLKFASERLDEAIELAENENSDQVLIALQGYEESIRAAETVLNERIIGTEDEQLLIMVLDETLELQTEKLLKLAAVAPSSVQSLIHVAMMKIIDFRVAMVIPSPRDTVTPGADETPILPKPSETGVASQTALPPTTPVSGGTSAPTSTPVSSSTSVPPTATNPTVMASPTAVASHTPSPTIPVATPSSTPTHTSTPTPTHTPSPTSSDMGIRSA